MRCERLQEVLQDLLKCKLLACCLSNLEEAQLTSHARNNTQGTPIPPATTINFEAHKVPSKIGPAFDLQVFDSELCDVVKAAYCSVRGSATSDLYDTIWAAENNRK